MAAHSLFRKMDPEKTTEEVFRLFRNHGDGNYLGESVCKTAHSIQCGMLADKEGSSKEIIIGAFLHDIGHLVGLDRGLPQMITDGRGIGTMDHDMVGASFLHDLGFPQTVCDIVGGHVSAKRYLVYKYPDYYKKMTSASKQTLEHQGGPMTKDDADAFESSPLCDVILRMRTWDEGAKDVDTAMDDIDKYRKMCVELLRHTA